MILFCFLRFLYFVFFQTVRTEKGNKRKKFFRLLFAKGLQEKPNSNFDILAKIQDNLEIILVL
ncbi:MAG: hypothetical protein D6805_07135 [Planctomycetota bacterium]|nr:MAG: hypothetical protein D6805_07135 [Planctomycetota bacterium]